jgi:hypothetical protein
MGFGDIITAEIIPLGKLRLGIRLVKQICPVRDNLWNWCFTTHKAALMLGTPANLRDECQC